MLKANNKYRRLLFSLVCVRSVVTKRVLAHTLDAQISVLGQTLVLIVPYRIRVHRSFCFSVFIQLLLCRFEVPWNRSYRKAFPQISLFFPRKTGNISKVWKLNGGRK